MNLIDIVILEKKYKYKFFKNARNISENFNYYDCHCEIEFQYRT